MFHLDQIIKKIWVIKNLAVDNLLIAPVLYSTGSMDLRSETHRSETYRSHFKLKMKKMCIFMCFIVEGWLTRFASPVLVLYSIFLETILSPEKFAPLTQC